MGKMVMTQIYNPDESVTSVAPFRTFHGTDASEEFKLKSILKISGSPLQIDHEMLELINKVESAAKIPAHKNFGAKTRNAVESFQAPAKASFKPTLTTLSAFCEEEEEV